LVYHSALLFSPNESIISRSFHPSSFIRVAGVQPLWSPLVQTLQSPGNESVENAAFSPDGQSLVSMEGVNDEKAIIRVWDIESGTETLQILSPKAQSAVFSKGSKVLITKDWDRRPDLWDASNGDRLNWVDDLPDTIRQIDISPARDHDIIASVDEDGQLTFRQSNGSSVVDLPVTRYQDVRCCAFSSDGLQLVSVHRDRMIRLWRWPGWVEDGFVGYHDFWTLLEEVVFIDSDTKIQIRGLGYICLWDVKSKTRLMSFEEPGVLPIAAISPKTLHRFSASGHGGDISVWNFDGTRNQATPSLIGHTSWVRSLNVSPDGNTLVSAGFDGTVRLWNIADAIQRHSALDSFQFDPRGGDRTMWHETVISPDGTLVAVCWPAESGLTTIQFYDPDTALPNAVYPTIKSSTSMNHFQFSVDSKAFSNWEEAWEVVTGEKIERRDNVGTDIGSSHKLYVGSGERGDWDMVGRWVRHKGKYVTMLPSSGRLQSGNTNFAVIVEFGTWRLYVLHLTRPV